jgi:hypothetical protein
MLMLTLDTNCIVALDRDEKPHSSCLRNLLELHSAGMVTLRLTAMSASEKQPDTSYLKDFSKFQERLDSLGLGQLELLKPICYFDVSFWDWCVSAEKRRLIWTSAFTMSFFQMNQRSCEKQSNECLMDRTLHPWKPPGAITSVMF